MVRLQAEPIRAEELLRAVGSTASGAIVLFLGTVRERNAGRRVLFLEYEAYPAMAEAEMARIEEEARGRFPVARIEVVHRTGRLALGEASVAIAVAAEHRGAAQDACRFVIDELKRRVPIWKKEHFEGGAVWIEGNRGNRGQLP